METVAARSFRAMRRLEFNLGLPRASSFQHFLPGVADRFLLWPWLILSVLAAIATCTAFRTMDLHWHRVPNAILIPVSVIWGLAGLIPMAGAVLSAATFRRFQPQLRTKPLSDLLPLAEQQVLWARCQGRLLLFAVYLAAGLILGLAARLLMVSLDLVSEAPGLLDPWHVAAVVVFAALTLGATWLKLADRRITGAGALLFFCYALPPYIMMMVAASKDFFVFGRWNIVFGTGMILAHVIWTSALASLVYLRWPHGLGLGYAAADRAKSTNALTRSRAVDIAGVGVILEMETARAADLPGLLRRSFNACLRIALWTGAGVLIVQALILVTEAAYAALHGVPGLSQGAFEGPQMVLFFPLLVYGIFIALLVPLAAWPERLTAVQRQRIGTSGPHFGGLLPVPPRKLWTRRLLWTLRTDLMLMVAGLLAYAAVWSVDSLLPFPQPFLAPARLARLVCLMLTASVGVFSYNALLSQVHRHIQLSGCLLYALVYAGMFGGMPLVIMSHHHSSTLLPLFALIWLGVVVVASIALMDPNWWPRRADGGRSVRAMVQAVAVLVSLPLSMGVAFNLLTLLIGGID